MNWSKEDHRYMGLALQLAEKGQYTARPNPMVGCVIVKDGQIIGQGWHQKFGKPHAEINALALAGELAKNATCYVTLEPCAHQGKTGPCATALIKAGVCKVIAAMQDPNPQVSGKGFELLEEAGIDVGFGLLEQQAVELNRGFVSRINKNKPWVSVKLAMSLDGRTALADGSSQWITGKAARLDVQRLRARQDAIITGVGTLLADNPSLTVRGDDQQEWFAGLELFAQPTRVLLDSQGQAKSESKIFNNDAEVWWVGDAQTVSASTEQFLASNVKTMQQLSLTQLMKECASHGFNNIMVEAGHKLAGEFIKQKLVDELIVYMAPKLMGNEALGLLDLKVNSMSDCPRFALKNIRQFGDDIRLTYRPE